MDLRDSENQKLARRRPAAGVVAVLLMAACSSGGSGSTGADTTSAASTGSGAIPTTTRAPAEIPTVEMPPNDGPVLSINPDGIGDAAPGLAGMGWNTGPLDALGSLRPPWVRIDADLGELSPSPDELDVGPLLDKLDAIAVQSPGAKPLVILSYMPAWLGQGTVDARCARCDPTRVTPSDWTQWESLVEAVVTAAATHDHPAVEFEVWNEPDLPVFWQDGPTRFLELADHTHRAVEAAEATTGVDLTIGGPAASLFLMNPQNIADYLSTMTRLGHEVGFLSFHWYANYPCLGPDGNEGLGSDELYESLKCTNQQMTPVVYERIVTRVRASVDDALAPGQEAPPLFIDEWGISAGGFDTRNDTNVGAAFTLASLIVMERTGIDRAYRYRAVAGDGAPPGDWGVVGYGGTKTPSWWIFDAWLGTRGNETDGVRLDVHGDPPDDVWVRATHGGDDGTVTVLVANTAVGDGAAHPITLDLATACGAGAASRIEVATLDAETPDLDHPVAVRLSDGERLGLPVPPHSATRVVVHCASDE